MRIEAAQAGTPEATVAVKRARLPEWRAKILSHRLTWFSAPAGYGKTVALTQLRDDFAAEGAACCWLRIETEVDMASLAGRLIDILPGCDSGRSDHAPIAGDDTALQTVLAGLGEPSVPVFLFMDGAELLAADARRWFERLVKLLPPTCRIICASRSNAGFRLARLRAFGSLHELGSRDLRFAPNEVESLAPALDPGLRSTLLEHSEGWIAGLNFMLRRLASGGECDPAATAGELRAFFQEETLWDLDVSVRELLLDLAIVKEFDADLCVGLTGNEGARQSLDTILERNLFVEPVDRQPGRYRMHGLFRQALLHELNRDPNRGAALHRTASNWYAERHLVDEALDHAVAAGDESYLSELLERFAEDFHRSGRLWDLDIYAARLPTSAIAQSPRLLMGLAWLRTRARRFSETRKLLSTSRTYLDALKSRDAGLEEARLLEPLLAHQEAMLSFAQDEDIAISGLCRDLLSELETDHPHFACTLYGPMISAAARQFHFEDLDRYRAQAHRRIEQLDYRIARVSLEAAAGVALVAAGRAPAAIDALECGLAVAVDHAGPGTGLSALVSLPLAAACLEIGRLDRAEALLRENMPVAHQFCAVDQLLAGHLTQCRLAILNANPGEAHRALDIALEDALDSGSQRFRLHIVAERTRLLVREGALDRAIKTYRQAKLAATAEALAPRHGATPLNSLIAMTWTRIRLAQNRGREALALARQWRSVCMHRSALSHTVGWDLLATRIYASDGDMRAAQRTLRQALVAAEPGQIARPFLEEGGVIQDLLGSYADGRLATSNVDIFAARLAGNSLAALPGIAAPATGGDGDTANLSAKEREILGLLGNGLRNREIGERLGISEGTVKWYVHHIYSKTGVARRTQASQLARTLGLLPPRPLGGTDRAPSSIGGKAGI